MGREVSPEARLQEERITLATYDALGYVAEPGLHAKVQAILPTLDAHLTRAIRTTDGLIIHTDKGMVIFTETPDGFVRQGYQQEIDQAS